MSDCSETFKPAIGKSIASIEITPDQPDALFPATLELRLRDEGDYSDVLHNTVLRVVIMGPLRIDYFDQAFRVHAWRQYPVDGPGTPPARLPDEHRCPLVKRWSEQRCISYRGHDGVCVTADNLR